MTNKDKYIAFCGTRDYIPLFSQPWWLDAVCVDGRWDVCVVEEKGNILAVLPYYFTKYKNFRVIKMPLLTPYLGIQFFHLKKHKFLIEQDLTTQLITQLPKTSYVQQVHHPNFKNWLPFYWAGFKQTTMYSFNLKINNLDVVYNSFRKNLRKDLKKAGQLLTSTEGDDFELFYKLHQSMFQKQKMTPPYSYDFFNNLDRILKEKKRRKIIFTSNQEGKIIAAGYFVWDKQTAYFLASGREGPNRLAMTWTTWQAIKIFSPITQSFDFAGSIIKNITFFNSKFTDTTTPYHHITKGKNKLFDILKILKP